MNYWPMTRLYPMMHATIQAQVRAYIAGAPPHPVLERTLLAMVQDIPGTPAPSVGFHSCVRHDGVYEVRLVTVREPSMIEWHLIERCAVAVDGDSLILAVSPLH